MPSDRSGPLAPPPAPIPTPPTPSSTVPGSRPTDEDPERDLAGALHEVSNALTVVVGWLERARAGGEGSAELMRALDIAFTRAVDGRHIARRAIGAAPGALSAEQPVEQILTEALAGVLPEAQARGARLSSSLEAGADGGVLLDEARLALQILTNLLLNAIAFSPPGGVVLLEARCRGDEIELRVSDEGPGIVPERRDRVFQRGRSTRDGGAGIGLWHARALAHRCGGNLSLEPSERGARFLLRWPRAEARPVSSPQPLSKTTLGGKRVLVVEDDGAVLVLLETALSARGAHVVCARTAAELAVALASGAFDAALVDLSPIASDVTGHIRSLRSACPSGRLIVISGSATAPPDEAVAFASAWVRKPFDLGEILASLSAG